MRNPILKPVLMLTAAAAFVAGLLLAGHGARVWLDRRGHYDVSFAAIECPTPPGLSQAAFLAEVQYLGGLPDRVSARDPATVLRVTAAFAGHPWVEQVEGISLGAPEGPRVRLRIRTPVLAVGDRAVDGHGVLLPSAASVSHLLAFRGAVPEPKGPAGAPWGDAGVEGAARIAALLGPFQDRLKLKDVEMTRSGLIFTGTVTLKWGKADDADTKLTRLKALLVSNADLRETINLDP